MLRLLLTSLPIETFEQVCTVIDYYTCRWQIEVYFRVLKSGCKVEDRQFEDADRYLPCLALYMVVAWRVMYVIMLGREYPDMSCAACQACHSASASATSLNSTMTSHSSTVDTCTRCGGRRFG